MSRTSSPPAAPPAPPEGSTGGLQVARKGNSDRAKSPPGGPPRAHGAPHITSPVRNAGIDVTEVADEALGQHLSRSVLHFARGGRRDGEAAGTGRPPGRAGRRDGKAAGTGRPPGRAGRRDGQASGTGRQADIPLRPRASAQTSAARRAPDSDSAGRTNYVVTAYSPIFAVRNTRSSSRSKL